MPGHTTAAAVFFGAVVMLSVASAEEGPPDVIECKIIHEGSREDICTFVTTPANNCRTESIFPYVTAYYCWGGALLPGFLMFCYIVWNLLLFVVLATTADDYFAPSLTTLCNWLGLRERIAGLTFLALGNGAADMFSVIAAVQVGATDLAVGALQGGSMCVTTVVTVGVLCAVQGGEVKASGVFFADLFVNVISCIAVFAILYHGDVNILEACLLLLLYAVYVLGVSIVGHGYIPPMREVDRVAWRQKKESDQALLVALASDDAMAQAGVAVVGPMYEPTEQEQRLAKLGRKARNAAWVRFRSLRPKEGAPFGGASLEERRTFSYRLKWHATSSMGSAWAEKSWDGKALYAFESLFHLLRSLTTPITPPVECLKGNKWNQGFERCTASLNPMCFSAFMAFWLMRRVYGDSYAERMAPWQFPSVGPLPLPVACFVLTTPLGVGVWFLTKSQMPGWLRSAYVVPGFCSAVIWFDIFACELVACLQTFGFIFDIPTSLLGVTILAWGNSIGDFFADRAVARDGYVKMAISGCYGEPNFPRLIGLGLAFLFVTIASSPEPYTQGVQIDAVTVLGFFMQWVVLFTVGVLAVWDNFRLRKQVLGPVLLIQYLLFLILSGMAVFLKWDIPPWLSGQA